MRVAISNLAWDPDEDDAVGALLSRHGVDAIDLAVGKYFPDPANAHDEQVTGVRERWRRRGVEIVGLQALLFGTSGLNLFGGADAQRRMLAHLDAVCRVARTLGAKHLVFGSPRNRDRSGVPDAAVSDIAVEFFRRLGDIAGAHGVTVCLEPNPPSYGANYMTTAEETAAVVRAVSHPAIRLQFDTGALAVSGEGVEEVVARHGELFAHAHASEPQLVPLGEGAVDHSRAARALAAARPDLVVSIEMLAPSGAARLPSIERALALAVECYATRSRAVHPLAGADGDH